MESEGPSEPGRRGVAPPPAGGQGQLNLDNAGRDAYKMGHGGFGLRPTPLVLDRLVHRSIDI